MEDPSRPPNIARALAGSSPGVAGANVSIPSDNEVLRREEVGEGGKSATALDTQVSNSSWVILDNAEESIVSMNWIAPDKDDW